jgi:hypothetical protein
MKLEEPCKVITQAELPELPAFGWCCKVSERFTETPTLGHSHS